MRNRGQSERESDPVSDDLKAAHQAIDARDGALPDAFGEVRGRLGVDSSRTARRGL